MQNIRFILCTYGCGLCLLPSLLVLVPLQCICVCFLSRVFDTGTITGTTEPPHMQQPLLHTCQAGFKRVQTC